MLDNFLDCYPGKYSWFAAYYLICRLVIMLIVYFANSDYSYMIYYLQTACVIIVMIHVLVQPYKNDVLNVMDTVILLTLLLVVNPSAFNFSLSSVKEIIGGFVVLPIMYITKLGIYPFVKNSKLAYYLHFKPRDAHEDNIWIR